MTNLVKRCPCLPGVYSLAAPGRRCSTMTLVPASVVSLIALLLFCVARGIPVDRSISPCDAAAETVGFFTGTLRNCSSDPNSSPICAQINPGLYWKPGRSNMLRIVEPYLDKNDLSFLSSALSDLDLMLTAQINWGGSAGPRAANPGEIAYVLHKITEQWGKLLPNESSSVLPSTFWQVWTNEWTKAAMRVDLSTGDAWSYLRAANYFFIGAQPYPLTPAAQKALLMSYEYTYMHLHLQQAQNKLQWYNVSIPYTTDDGSQVLLPGIAVSPVTSSPPQLIVATSGGLDWPLPGEVVLSLYTYLDAGYAVMYYEGPGQGMTPYDPVTPLRFTPNWDRVLSAAALYARTNLSFAWDSSKGLTAVSESLGGYLLTQACTLVDHTLVQGCVTDPATPNMGFSVIYSVFGQFIAPFASVSPSLISAACPVCVEYAANYWGVNATHAPPQACFNADPLASDLCAANCSLGNEIMSMMMYYAITANTAGVAPSLFAWLTLTLVAPGPNTYNNVSELMFIFDTNPHQAATLVAQAVARLLTFVVSEERVAATKILIAAFGGEEDFSTQSSQFNAYTAALPQSSLAQSKFFEAHTGAASHCEAGAWSVRAQHLYAFFETVASNTLLKLHQ